MSRNPLVVAVAILVVGATIGCVAPGQPNQPARPKMSFADLDITQGPKPEIADLDITQGPKPAKKWSYLTLTEVRKNNKDDSCDVFYSLANAGGICNGGWIQVGEKLGMRLAAEHPRKNSASDDRVSVLCLLGEYGWELASVHKTELDRLAWVFKKER